MSRRRLLVRWLGQAASFERLTLMFQHEVAERNLRRAGYTGLWAAFRVGAVDVCGTNCRAPAARSVHPAAEGFVGGGQLTPHERQPDPAVFARMEGLTAAAFGQRRKMLRGSLRGLGGEALLARAEIAPNGARRHCRWRSSTGWLPLIMGPNG